MDWLITVATGSTIGTGIGSGNCVAISDYLNCIFELNGLVSFSSILLLIYSFYCITILSTKLLSDTINRNRIKCLSGLCRASSSMNSDNVTQY